MVEQIKKCDKLKGRAGAPHRINERSSMVVRSSVVAAGGAVTGDKPRSTATVTAIMRETCEDVADCRLMPLFSKHFRSRAEGKQPSAAVVRWQWRGGEVAVWGRRGVPVAGRGWSGRGAPPSCSMPTATETGVCGRGGGGVIDLLS